MTRSNENNFCISLNNVKIMIMLLAVAYMLRLCFSVKKAVETLL